MAHNLELECFEYLHSGRWYETLQCHPGKSKNRHSFDLNRVFYQNNQNEIYLFKSISGPGPAICKWLLWQKFWVYIVLSTTKKKTQWNWLKKIWKIEYPQTSNIEIDNWFIEFEANTPDIQGFVDQVIAETNQGKPDITRFKQVNQK